MGSALLAAASIAGVGWLVGSATVRSAWLIPRRRRAPPAPPAHDIRLASLDGLVLAATYWPGARPDAPGILIVHGLHASRRVIEPNAAWFCARGYAVLTLDLRGHGDSDRGRHSFGWMESLDTHAAFAWLKRRQGGAPCAIIGISMGGASALIGPRGPVAANALVLQGAFATFRQTVRVRIALVAGIGLAWLLEPLLSFQTLPRLGVWPSQLAPSKAVARVPCPVLVIGGEKDPFMPPHETRSLYEAVRGSRALWIVPGLGHGGVSNTLAEGYRSRVHAFLRETIGEP